MSTPFLNLVLAGVVCALVLFLASLPWIRAIDTQGFRRAWKNPTVLGYVAGGSVAAGAVLAMFFSARGETASLEFYGRWFGALVHLMLIASFLAVVPALLGVVWPKGGAIALSAFRECVRQPMFWLIFAFASVLMLLAMVVPYYTFGEDYKLFKQVGYDLVMLSAMLFGLLAASISINEEIEGRSAITVMSKPVSRRQFLVGKFVGIALACAGMTLLLGWVLTWALYIKPFFDRLDDVSDSMPVEASQYLAPKFEKAVPTPEGGAFAAGAGTWAGETAAHHVGLIRTYGQVLIMVAISTALATRMQFVVNLVLCFVIFLLGNLAPVLVAVTRDLAKDNTPFLLVSFLAQLFNAVLPALESFDMGPAIIRDTPLPFFDFTVFAFSVLGYAILYTVIAILVGLLLFEDRDLA